MGPRMKMLLILFLGIPFSAMNSYASQLRCHTEEVRSSGDDPVLANDCTRLVCGPTYAGKIAFDSCYEPERIIEGEGEDAITVKTGYVRLPERENSSEEWEEIVVQTGPERALTCGRYFVPPEEENPEEESGSIFDRLVPDLLAQGGEEIIYIAPTDIAWSEAEKRLVADKLNELANRIATALVANNPLEVGGPNTEHRAYTIATGETAKWMAHALSPQTNPCFPATLRGLNSRFHPVEQLLRAPANCAAEGSSPAGRGLRVYWDPCEGNSCTVATVYALNLIKVNQTYRPRAETNGATLALILTHEGLHTLNHFQDALRGGSYVANMVMTPYPDAPIITLYQFLDKVGAGRPLSLPEILPAYSDESSARMVEAILFHFMNAGERSEVSNDLRKVDGSQDSKFSLIRRGRFSQARMRFMPYFYIYKWEWNRMSNAQRQAHGNSFSTWRSRCSGFNPDTRLAKLETLYKKKGGFLGLPPGSPGTAAQTGTVLDTSIQPGVDHNTTVSPDTASLCEGPVPSSEEEVAPEAEVPAECEEISEPAANLSNQEEILANCEPPDCERNPEECRENPEEVPEEPDPTAGIPGCVLYQFEYSGRMERSCYDWCWEDANNRLAPGLCQPLREDDLSSGCALSSQSPNCTQGLAQLADACEDAGAGTDPCREACNAGALPLSRGPDDLCRATCVALAGDLPRYCLDYCVRQNWRGSSLCTEICEANSGIAECDPLRAVLACRERCYTACGNDNDVYCSRACDEAPDRTTFTCPDPPPPPPPPPSEGGSDCPSGWTYRRGSVPVARDGCFPFVGNIKCCGGTCEPDGSNEACTDTGWCGCDPDRDETLYYNSCLWPSSSGWDETMQINPNGTDADQFCTNGVGISCSRNFGYAGECGCFGWCNYINCYPYIVSVPPGMSQPFYAGQCCEDFVRTGYSRVICVTRSSLGLPP